MTSIEQTIDANSAESSFVFDSPCVETKLTSLVEEKAKIFFEILANASFYLNKFADLPEVYQKNFEAIKTCFGLPSFVKGTMAFSENVAKGKLALKKTVVDLSFLVSDAVDSVKTFKTLAIYTATDATLKTLGKIKNIASLVGVGIQLKDGLNEAAALSKIDPKKIDEEKVKDVKKAVDLKKRWISSELTAKHWDNLKNITGIAIIALNLTVGVMPWTFAVVGTCSIVAKVMNYMNKCDSDYWSARFIEILK